MPRTLVALDLDGTLLTEDSQLPPAHARAVDELRDDGHLVAICTGRPLLTARGIWERLALDTPMVCFNGGWVGVPGGPPFAAQPLDADTTRELLAFLADGPGVRCAYPQADIWLIDREIPHIAGWRGKYGAAIHVEPERFAQWAGSSHKVMYVAEPAHIPGVAAMLRARFGGRCHISVSQDDRIEVMPFAVTKAWGLERLAMALGVQREAVWAAGDAMNDLEMLRWAGHGCAMGHAPAALREVARHLLPPIDEQGLAALPALMRSQAALRSA